MDYQHASTPAREVVAPPPELAGGLWEQDLLGNGFLAEQLGQGATAGFWSRHFPSIFGPEEAPKVAETGIGEAAARIDRAMAAEELRDRFQVGEGDAPGRARVSQAEYDEIVALYSDIRLGRTQLRLDTQGLTEEEAAAFRGGAMKDIAALLQTPSGRALLGELAHGNKGHTTTLGRSTGDPNAEVSLPGLDPNDIDDRWKLHHALHGGGGADSRVNYAPGQSVHTDHDGEIRSDIALYHELTHAWHNGQGQNAEGAVSGKGGTAVGLEELETVGLGRWEKLPYTENRYRAERAAVGEQIAPRATYGGTSAKDHGL